MHKWFDFPKCQHSLWTVFRVFIIFLYIIRYNNILRPPATLPTPKSWGTRLTNSSGLTNFPNFGFPQYRWQICCYSLASLTGSRDWFAVSHILILILITAVLYSAPSWKSTQERSQPNPGQTMSHANSQSFIDPVLNLLMHISAYYTSERVFAISRQSSSWYSSLVR